MTRNPAPISRQIMRAGLWWTGAMLLGFALVLSLHEGFTRHQMLLDGLRTQARLLGSNSTAALMFDNADDAREILASLREAPDIQQAVILRGDGSIMAEYRAEGARACHALHDAHLRNVGVSTSLCGIALAERIMLHGQTQGVVVLETGLASTWRNLLNRLLGGALVAGLAFAVSVPLWRRMSTLVAMPLLELLALTRRVRDEHDFSHRSTVRGSAEVRELAASFNELMAELQLRSQQVQHELTHRRLAEVRLSELAYADSVTGLPNRHHLMERLDASLDVARQGLRPFALLYLDLDGFKAVNDTLGHDRGDELLRQVAARLRACLRTSDVVCRLGGDEFAVILPDVVAGSDVAQVAASLLEAVSQPYSLAGDAAQVSVSIGAALCPADGQDRQTLMRCADIAMYQAKEDGKRCFRLYVPSMSLRAERGQAAAAN